MARMARVADQLRQMFLTAGDVVTLTASGTGALEAAFVNLVRPGDHVLVAHAGKFGERWCEIALAHGVSISQVSAPWGERITPHALANALREAPHTAVVCLTHSETSTGVVHDLQALAGAARQAGEALVVVDAVSSAGAIPLHLDQWRIDACVSAAHKGFLCPPGLSFVALGSRARERVQTQTLPRYYFDLRPALAGLDAGGTPWTPAVSLINALSCSLDGLLKQGLTTVWARTRQLAEATRAGVAAAELALFAEHPGDVVTAVNAPPGVDARRVVAGLHARGFEIAGGQDAVKRRIFRIAHLGALADADLLALMDALADTLHELGAPPPERSAAREAAAAALSRMVPV